MEVKHYKYIGIAAAVSITALLIWAGWYFSALFVATLPVGVYIMWDKVD